jgi:hypothetical protein
LVVLVLSLNACAPTVQYVGKSYTPTTNVDLYFDTHDVKKDYEVIGKIDGIAGVFGSDFSSIQEKIVEEAKQKGADGVIIYSMEQRVIGTSSNTSTNAIGNSSANHRQWWEVAASSNTTSSNITQNVLHADFIKYINQ